MKSPEEIKSTITKLERVYGLLVQPDNVLTTAIMALTWVADEDKQAVELFDSLLSGLYDIAEVYDQLRHASPTELVNALKEILDKEVAKAVGDDTDTDTIH